MSDGRALLTDHERQTLSGEADVDDPYRYQTISRVGQRFSQLKGDFEAMEKYGELASIACNSLGNRRNSPGEARDLYYIQSQSIASTPLM